MSRRIKKKSYLNSSGDIFLVNKDLHKKADAYIHEEDAKNKEWIVSHNLDTLQVHVQVFENNMIVIPHKTFILDENNVKVIFSESQKGKAIITGLSSV